MYILSFLFNRLLNAEGCCSILGRILKLFHLSNSRINLIESKSQGSSDSLSLFIFLSILLLLTFESKLEESPVYRLASFLVNLFSIHPSIKSQKLRSQGQSGRKIEVYNSKKSENNLKNFSDLSLISKYL